MEILRFGFQLLLLFFFSRCQGEPFQSVKGVLDGLNLARTNPDKLVPIIKNKYLGFLNEKNIHVKWNRAFSEGREAIDEALNYLKIKTPVKHLELDLGLHIAAYLHSKYLGSFRTTLSHIGKNGSSVSERVEKYGKWVQIAENIAYMPSFRYDYQGVEPSIEFIIDDGVASRGHRRNCFLEKVDKVGIGIYHDDFTGRDYITFLLGDFDCANCGEITDRLKEESGWDRYLEEKRREFSADILAIRMFSFLILGILILIYN